MIIYSFALVEDKTNEVEFFLKKMFAPYVSEDFKFYLSAFLSASRTLTLILQRYYDIDGFEKWYHQKRSLLSKSDLARLFLDLRNEHVHGGEYPIKKALFVKDKSHFFLGKTESKKADSFHDKDIAVISRDYFILLLEVIFCCYQQFGVFIDPQQHYTKENYSKFGLDIDSAEIEIFGWVQNTLIDEGLNEDERWHELRGHLPTCSLNRLFYSYLGKIPPQPVVPDYINDFDFTPEEKGWIYPPAGFDSLDDFLVIKERNNFCDK